MHLQMQSILLSQLLMLSSLTLLSYRNFSFLVDSKEDNTFIHEHENYRISHCQSTPNFKKNLVIDTHVVWFNPCNLVNFVNKDVHSLL